MLDMTDFSHTLTSNENCKKKKTFDHIVHLMIDIVEEIIGKRSLRLRVTGDREIFSAIRANNLGCLFYQPLEEAVLLV